MLCILMYIGVYYYPVVHRIAVVNIIKSMAFIWFICCQEMFVYIPEAYIYWSHVDVDRSPKEQGLYTLLC